MENIEYTDTQEGLELLKKKVSTRNQMGGELHWNIMEDQCLKLADKLSADGVDSNEIAKIGGWTLR